MADEITIIAGISVAKSNLSATIPTTSSTVDLSGTKFIRNCQAVGTTYEAVSVGDLSSAGWCMIKNLDTTNYVEFGVEVSAAFYPFVKILPGETAGPFKLATLSAFARANTASVVADIFITEA